MLGFSKGIRFKVQGLRCRGLRLRNKPSSLTPYYLYLIPVPLTSYTLPLVPIYLVNVLSS